MREAKAGNEVNTGPKKRGNKSIMQQSAIFSLARF